MTVTASGVLVNDSLKKKALMCSVCQLAWSKYSHRGRFQATGVTSANVELGRGMHHQLS